MCDVFVFNNSFKFSDHGDAVTVFFLLTTSDMEVFSSNACTKHSTPSRPIQLPFRLTEHTHIFVWKQTFYQKVTVARKK